MKWNELELQYPFENSVSWKLCWMQYPYPDTFLSSSASYGAVMILTMVSEMSKKYGSMMTLLKLPKQERMPFQTDNIF